NEKSKQKINLKSVGIGNGWIDPRLQEKYYAPQACDGPYGAVLSKSVCQKMYAAYPQCYKLATKCYKDPTFQKCNDATNYCSEYIENPYYDSGLNPYDVRKKCDPNSSLCYDIEAGIDIWLNRPEIRSELGVAKQVGKFESCSNAVGENFSKTPDNMLNFADRLPILLNAGVRVLLYAGDADFICNWMGNKAVALDIEWSGKKRFNKAKDISWKVNGTDAGEVRAYDKLTYLRVFKAGHMVPFDQPEAGLSMLNTWLSNESFSKHR
ncbi:peptidase S10, serine carboxypeptidase, partial [Basidiobolus meristosporus CBS 931.73]